MGLFRLIPLILGFKICLNPDLKVYFRLTDKIYFIAHDYVLFRL